VRAVAVIAFALVLAHCTLTTDFDGLSGGASDAAPATQDTGTSPADASPIVRNDGSTVADADAGLLCPPTATFCSDFSSGSPNDLSQDVTIAGGGSLTIDGTLHSTLPAHAEPGSFADAFFNVISDTGRHAVLDVDMNFAVTDFHNKGNVSVLTLNVAADPYESVEIYVNPQGTSTTLQVPGSDLIYDNASEDIPRGQWVHIRLEADFTPHNGFINVAFNGDKVIEHTAIDFSEVNGSLRFGIGIVRSNYPTPAFDIRYDNLIVQP
jgi:hypothetical protein